MTPFHHFVQTMLTGVAVYAALGAVFALLFHLRGAVRLDHSVSGAGWFFRLLLTPGIIALWPLLAFKWRRATRGHDFAGPSESPVSARGLRRLHAIIIQILLVLLPIALAAAWFSRPAEPPVIRTPLPQPPDWSKVLSPK